MSAGQRDLDFRWCVGELSGPYRRHCRCFAIIGNRGVVGTFDPSATQV